MNAVVNSGLQVAAQNASEKSGEENTLSECSGGNKMLHKCSGGSTTRTSAQRRPLIARVFARRMLQAHAGGGTCSQRYNLSEKENLNARTDSSYLPALARSGLATAGLWTAAFPAGTTHGCNNTAGQIVRENHLKSNMKLVVNKRGRLILIGCTP